MCERGDEWALALESGKLLVAVNQTLVPLRRRSMMAMKSPLSGNRRLRMSEVMTVDRTTALWDWHKPPSSLSFQ